MKAIHLDGFLFIRIFYFKNELSYICLNLGAMKKLLLLSIIGMLAFASCDKKQDVARDNGNPAAELSAVSRTVAGITFTGTPYWVEMGTRRFVRGAWNCVDSPGICKYRQLTPSTIIPSGNRIVFGEMVRTDRQFLVAIDKASLLDTPSGSYKDCFINQATNTFTVSSDMYAKNVDDPNQNTIGDILIPRGTYPVVQDDNTLMIVFWNR